MFCVCSISLFSLSLVIVIAVYCAQYIQVKILNRRQKSAYSKLRGWMEADFLLDSGSEYQGKTFARAEVFI